MPAASKMRSTRSISWTWYCTVSRSSKHQVAFGPTAIVRCFLCASTRSRNSLRAVEYCSRLMRSLRASLFIVRSSNSVGLPQQLQRVRRFLAARQAGLDLMPGHRTIARVVVGVRIVDAPDDWTADLHRHVAILALHAVSAVVSRAALDRIDLGPGHEHQHVARLQAHVLDAGMTWNVVAHLAELVAEVRFQ